MCAYSILSETPSTVLDKLGIASLHFLTLDFDAKDGRDKIALSFIVGETNWIKEFAALKTAKYPKSENGENIFQIQCGWESTYRVCNALPRMCGLAIAVPRANKGDRLPTWAGAEI
jgi:hypothetical protein